MDFDIGMDLQNAYNEGYEQARNDIKRWVDEVIPLLAYHVRAGDVIVRCW